MKYIHINFRLYQFSKFCGNGIEEIMKIKWKYTFIYINYIYIYTIVPISEFIWYNDSDVLYIENIVNIYIYEIYTYIQLYQFRISCGKMIVMYNILKIMWT